MSTYRGRISSNRAPRAVNAPLPAVPRRPPPPGVNALLRLARRRPAALQAVGDLLSWGAAVVIAAAAADDLGSTTNLLGALRLLPVLLTAQLAIGLALNLYVRRWRHGRYEEARATVVTSLAVTGLTAVIDSTYVFDLVPVGVVLLAGVLVLPMMMATRYLAHLVDSRFEPRRPRRPLIVAGAGVGAEQVLASMLRDPANEFVPVALVDDDVRKVGHQVCGVPVVGTSDDLAEVAARFAASAVLIAIPSAEGELVRRVTVRCLDAGLEVRVLPTPRELLGTPVRSTDMRPPTSLDLLGRREIDTDLSSIAGYLTGKRVLVTGAGGSIGSELCRHLAKWGPSELILLDRDESALHAVQLSLEGRALLDKPSLVIADIRDRARIKAVFATWRPEVVFHAAALKHLPLLEMHPREAIKSNVLGTVNLLDAAVEMGVGRFVNVSTDKAADPVSILGYTKRIAERLTAAAAQRASGTYLSVRFGNVLGSRGSMLATFQAQVAAGGPITVTHPDVTRFFMTIEEAVQLLVQAGAIGRTGEALVLDMGAPVRILDVARQMISTSNAPLEIEFTGLRHGEKLHEVLWGTGEVDERPVHPLVSHVVVPPLAVADLAILEIATAPALERLALVALCGMDEVAAITGEPDSSAARPPANVS